MKFWRWGPTTILHNIKSVAFFFFKITLPYGPKYNLNLCIKTPTVFAWFLCIMHYRLKLANMHRCIRSLAVTVSVFSVSTDSDNFSVSRDSDNFSVSRDSDYFSVSRDSDYFSVSRDSDYFWHITEL